MSKLHLGCGNVILPGWINLDAAPAPRVDVVDNAMTLSSIPLQSVDTIYSSCMLEHFSHRDTVSILREWRKRLIPGGTLRVSVPDFSAAVAEYRNGRPLRELLGLIIGGQKDDYDRHGALFDFGLLKAALDASGFIDVHRYDWTETEHASHDDYASAYLPHMDHSGRLMSLNVEATVERCASIEMPPEWYALGDSHVWIFTQADAHPGLFDEQRAVVSLDRRMRVNRLGPWTVKRATSEGGREIILREVEDVPTTTKIILSFGEIDCRCLVMPEVEKTGESMGRVCARIASQYMSLVESITAKGYEVFIWNAPPPTGGPCYNIEYPFRGTYEECRAAVERLNTEMKLRTEEANSPNAHFIDIYSSLVHGSRTQVGMYSDHIHLKPSKVWPLARKAISRSIEGVSA